MDNYTNSFYQCIICKRISYLDILGEVIHIEMNRNSNWHSETRKHNLKKEMNYIKWRVK